MAGRTALLLGATGRVGRHCLGALLADPAYEAVVVLGRRPVRHAHPKLRHHVIDFDHLALYADLVRGQDVFCCLGTTLKRAGSPEGLRRVEGAYPLGIARLALEYGAEQFLYLSAWGAHPTARRLYPRVKGEAEAALGALPFYGVYNFRPAHLDGERSALWEAAADETRLRSVLAWGAALAWRHHRVTPAATVAAAMVAVAKKRPGGRVAYGPERMQAMARPQRGRAPKTSRLRAAHLNLGRT